MFTPTEIILFSLAPNCQQAEKSCTYTVIFTTAAWLFVLSYQLERKTNSIYIAVNVHLCLIGISNTVKEKIK